MVVSGTSEGASCLDCSALVNNNEGFVAGSFPDLKHNVAIRKLLNRSSRWIEKTNGWQSKGNQLPLFDLGSQLSSTSALYHRPLNFTFTASPGFSEGSSFPSFKSLSFALISFRFGKWAWSCHLQFVFQITLTLALTEMTLTFLGDEAREMMLNKRSNC